MSYSPKYHLSEKLRRNLHEIEILKDNLRGSRILPEVEVSIRHRASIESVYSSTSIEGNPLDLNEVREVISSSRRLSRDEYFEIEVQNYKTALDFIDQRRHLNSPIALSDVLKLHQIITSRLLDETRCGQLRQNPVHIETSSHEIVYYAAPPSIVPSAVDDLLTWLDNSCFLTHPVLLAGILHYQLTAIHPFSDGNGRTARALTSLYLALNHYDCDGTLSLDAFYASDRPAYYETLRRVSGKTYSVDPDLTPWLEYFTDGFLSSLHILDAEIRLLNLSLQTQNFPLYGSEVRIILSHIFEFGSITISEAEKLFPTTSRRSLQRKLKRLVDDGHLSVQGSTHTTRYILRNHPEQPPTKTLCKTPTKIPLDKPIPPML